MILYIAYNTFGIRKNDRAIFRNVNDDVAFDIAAVTSRHFDFYQYIVAVALKNQFFNIVAKLTCNLNAVSRPASYADFTC